MKLRMFEKADIDRLVQLANDQDVNRYMTAMFAYTDTHIDVEWWIREVSKKGLFAQSSIKIR